MLAALLILAVGVLTAPRLRRRLTAGWVKRRQRRQARRRASQIGSYCSRIARRLQAGETLLQAMTADTAGEFPGDFTSDLAEPVKQLLEEHRRGTTLARAVARWAERDGTEETALLSTAVRLASQQMGADPALFDHVAHTIRTRDELVAEAHVQIAQARASIWVVAALPWVIALVLVADRGAPAEVLLGTGLGWFCIGGALLLEFAGVGWMRGLINRSVPQ